MEIFYENIEALNGNALIARWNKFPYYSMFPLHKHVEYEIFCNVKSTGTVYVGDSKQELNEGELLFFGSMLPHKVESDEIYTKGLQDYKTKGVVIQFDESLVEMFNTRDEFDHIADLLNKSARGLWYPKEFFKKNEHLILGIPNITQPLERIMRVIKLIDRMAAFSEYRTLASLSYINHSRDDDKSKISGIIEYLANNYQNKISLEDIAQEYHVSKTALCNFFKRKTGTTLVNYINSLRVSKVKQLLVYDDDSIAEIAFTCGFNNISNFNRIFKSYTGLSPREFRDRWDK